MIEQFHFLRPAWLLALIPLVWIIWHSLKLKRKSRSWQSVVDARLLPHLLKGSDSIGQKRLPLLFAFCGILSIVALAGPVWERLPQPIFNQQSALVVALDLSRSMDVGDIKPSRLVRARHKVADLLAMRKEGQTALISYAAEAFIVTPLTEDNATITALLPSLETGIMPAQGSRADKAVSQALELFTNSGISQGDILLVTDGITDLEFDNIEKSMAKKNGFRISILAVGTEDGGPIPLANGGFLKDEEGAIVIPRLQLDVMKRLVESADGALQNLVASDADIDALADTFQVGQSNLDARASELNADLWREQGPWLVLLIMPLIALMFRRGLILVLFVFLVPLPPQAQAFEWSDIWQNENQKAKEAFDKEDHRTAAELFEHTDWKASSLYRHKSYEQALQYWQNSDSDEAVYNQGNALARLGKLEDAIAAYDRVLEKNPDHEDAAFNKKQIEELLEQQQPQQQDSEQQSEQNQQDQSDQQNSDQNQPGQSRQAEGDPSDDRRDQASSQQSQPPEPEADKRETESADNNQSSETQAQQAMQQDLDQQMSEQAAEQWLRKIPDDPGGLLRRKFLYQYRQRSEVSKSPQPW